MTTERLQVNSPSVVWEDFNDEVVIVNLESGQYFSARDAGAAIWRRAANGYSTAELLQEVLNIYDVEQSIAAAAIDTLITEARNQNLITVNPTLQMAVSINEVVMEKRKFINSSLEVFSDMQDILLLDPIHEVDASGWPAQQETNPAQQSSLTHG